MILKKSINFIGKNLHRKFSEIVNQGCHFIKPRLYADANLSKEKDYYDFESMNLKFGY